MKKITKYTIYNNEYHSEDEQDYNDAWHEFLELNGYTEEDCDYVDWFYDELEINLEDEMANLNEDVDGQIIAIADIGTWRGRIQGYKLLTTNVNSIFDACHTDGIDVYADRYNVRATCSHHDGTNYILFRILKNDVNRDKFLNMIYNGEEIDSKTLCRYTKSLRPAVANIYGW